MADQTTKRLLEPILDQGIQNINFFNGRVLTAGDLKSDRDANRRQHEQLGRAAGEGIVYGLEVSLVADGATGDPPVVSIARGLAVNRTGQAVALAVDVPQLTLLRQEEAAPVAAGLFQVCAPPKSGANPPAAGIYVLVATPVSGFREQAPMVGMNGNGKAAGCGSRYAVEGVQFRLEELVIDELTQLSQATRSALLDLMTKTDKASLSKLRNWLAHVCFGSEELVAWPRDPLAPVAETFFGSVRAPFFSYGALDTLRTNGALDDCDVPLALLCWTTAGVKWVDLWAVRRRLIAPLNARRFPLLTSDRRSAETEAMIQQFQDQVRDMLLDNSLNLGTVKASERFRYLPPAGMLPLASSGLSRGFGYDTFFASMTTRSPIFIEGAQLRPLLQEATTYPPIDTTAQVVVWLYVVRENAQALLSSAQRPQGYIVFASGHMPYRGEARYDVHHWDFGNFS